MRLVLKIDGGFAPTPGRTRPLRVDTSVVDPAVAAELDRLAAAVASSAHPSTRSRSASTPDARRYCLSIERGDAVCRLEFSDPIASPEAATLVARVCEIGVPDAPGRG